MRRVGASCPCRYVDPAPTFGCRAPTRLQPPAGGRRPGSHLPAEAPADHPRSDPLFRPVETLRAAFPTLSVDNPALQRLRAPAAGSRRLLLPASSLDPAPPSRRTAPTRLPTPAEPRRSGSLRSKSAAGRHVPSERNVLDRLEAQIVVRATPPSARADGSKRRGPLCELCTPSKVPNGRLAPRRPSSARGSRQAGAPDRRER